MSDYLILGAISNAVNFPSISAEEAPKLKPFVALADKLGSFAGQFTETGIKRVQVSYEGVVAKMNTRALTSAAIAGLLRPMLQDVNVVSAPIVAKDRGIVVEETRREAEGDYESLITVAVVTDRQTRWVSGTVYADGRPRIVNIKGIRIDAEFGPSMLYVTNQDRPGLRWALRHAARRRRHQHRDLSSRPRGSRWRRHCLGRSRWCGCAGGACASAANSQRAAGKAAAFLTGYFLVATVMPTKTRSNRRRDKSRSARRAARSPSPIRRLGRGA